MGTTFRAPPLTSLDPGQVTSLQFLGGAFRADDVVGNPALDPEKATTYNVGPQKAGSALRDRRLLELRLQEPAGGRAGGGIFNTLFPTATGTGNCGAAALAALQARFTFNGPAAWLPCRGSAPRRSTAVR